MKNINFTLFFLIAIFTTSYSQVQRINGLTISGNMNWRGTVIISGDVIVEQKSRLIIEPGTKVLFEPNQDLTNGGTDKTRSEIIVRGILIARGLPGRKITFSSNSKTPRMGDWYSVEFLHLKSGTLLDYCVIEYAHNGITIKNSNIQVVNSELRYNYHAGIRAEVKANPEIKNSILSENGYAGLICELGSKPILTENLISLNRIGVVVFSLSQPNLGNQTPGDNYNPGRNSIFGNEEFNFYNHSNKKVFAENNYWGDEGRSSIAVKVYDNDDNSKYGSVDYMPVMRRKGQQNLGNMLLLAQNTNVPRANSANIPAVGRANQPVVSIENSFQVVEDTTTKISAVQDLAIKEELPEEDMDLSKKLDEMSPLMASTTIPESRTRQLPVNNKDVKSQIDYNQVFLELFLDGGKKEYRNRPKIKTSSVPRTVWKRGEVRIKVVVDKDGNVENASILRGINQIIDYIVLETVKKYEYQSGQINGQAVSFTISEVFRFE